MGGHVFREVLVTRVLFVPHVEEAATSERTPLLYRTLKASHDVLGVPSPLDKLIYDPDRTKWPRYLLYAVDKILLGLWGLLLARRHRTEVILCATAHHALPGLVIARILGIRCIWDSQGNVELYSRSLRKGWFFSSTNTMLERFIGRRVDDLVTVSDRDADEYVSMGVPQSKITVIPISVVISEIDAGLPKRGASEVARDRPSSGRATLLFFGSFKYRPNLEALHFINASLAPHLARTGVRCEIRIAGRDIPEMPFHPLVKPYGFVPNIFEQIRESDLCLVPIWKGVGILTKVLDVMVVGTPLVLSDFVAQIVPGVRDGVHAFVSPSEMGFSRRVSEALADPEGRRSVASHARKLVEERYDWGQHARRYDAVVRGTRGLRGR